MSGAMDILFELGGICLLLVLSGFFSGSETALFSLSRTEARRMREGTPGEKAATRLLGEPQHLLSTLLVGNLLVNILLASQIAGLARRMFGEGGVGVAIGASTFLLLIFGEVTPKTVAVRHARAFARIIAVPLLLFSRIIAPVRIAAGAAAKGIMRACGLQKATGWGALTRDELRAMLHMGEAHGAASVRERVIAEQILELASIAARDIMVPRTDIVGVADDLPLEEAFRLACAHVRSRIPVYHEDLDDIWGFVPVVDLARWHGRPEMRKALSVFRPAVEAESAGNDGAEAEHGGPVYPVCVFPESARVEHVLTEMRTRKAQFAVLVDEYGGTAGMLTMDDILNELMGRVPGRRAGESGIEVGENGLVRVSGRVSLRLLNRELAHPIEDPGGADTVGGYIAALLGRLPRPGDTVWDAHYQYRVIRMAGRRVDAVELRPAPSSETSDAPKAPETVDSCS